MLEKFTYKNHKGQLLTFGENGVYANYSDLYDYSWSYSISNRKIKDIYREPKSKTLPCVFFGATGEQCRENRNKAFEIIEADVIAKKKGVLTVGDFYMNCMLIGSSNTKYLETERLIHTSFILVTDDPVWRREELHVFPVSSSESSAEGKSYPYNYPYNYSASGYQATEVNNTFTMDTSFVMTIYGPCVNPQITIGGHIYGMNITLYSGEQVVIDSEKKTILKYDSARLAQNVFGKRYKENSIFEKIPEGISTLSWPGTYGFDLNLVEKRSEPMWRYSAVSTDDISGIVEVDTGFFYLLDENGNNITDSENRLIIVEA